jgi:hypothetical protein
MSDNVYNDNGKQLAWIGNGDIFVAADGKRTVHDGQLYSLQGELSGKSTRTTASCFGTAHQVPGIAFQATLIRIAD